MNINSGDPSTFPHSTALVVGPGTKAAVLPGYPADPNSQHLETDFAYVDGGTITASFWTLMSLNPVAVKCVKLNLPRG